MRRLLAVALLCLPILAAEYTVCASGCDYSNLQTAFNAVAGGDTLTLTAGETFAGCFILPYKAGQTEYITVRSSAHASLPTTGTRVDPDTDAANMPTIEPSGAECVPLKAGHNDRYTDQNGVDVDNDWINHNVYPTYQILAEGQQVTFGGGSTRTLPGGLAYNTIYFARNPSGGHTQFSLTADGAIIDLTSQGDCANASLYSRPWIADATPAHHWKFEGIRIATKTGTVQTYQMVMIGWNETETTTVPHDIEFHRVIVTGFPAEDGPQHAVALNGADLTIRDSWIGHVKKNDGYESHGILMVNTPGPVLIENNYISAASENILAGGQGAAIYQQVATDVTIRGNHIVKAGYMHYKSGAGAPSGACYYGQGTGAFYRNTTPSPNTCANGACYVCQSNGTWAQDTGATYRNKTYLTKSAVEFKGCDGCLVEGNVIEAVFAGPDGGNVSCLLMSQVNNGTLYNYIGDTTLRNNWCKDTWSGLYIQTDGDAYTTQNHDVTFSNNLITGMANFPAMSVSPLANDVYPRPINISSGATGIIFDHNTFRAATGMSYEAQFGLTLLTNAGGPESVVGYVKNNLLSGGAYGVFDSTALYNCTSSSFGLWFGTASSPKYVANNVLWGLGGNPFGSTCNPSQNFITDALNDILFVGTDQSDPANSALQATSPYSASCTESCAFAATDSTDMGVNIAALNAAIAGAISGLPTVLSGISGSVSISGFISILP